MSQMIQSIKKAPQLIHASSVNIDTNESIIDKLAKLPDGFFAIFNQTLQNIHKLEQNPSTQLTRTDQNMNSFKIEEEMQNVTPTDIVYV